MRMRIGFAMIGAAAIALAACQQADEPAEPVTEEQIAAQTPNAPANRPIDLLPDGLVIAAPEAGGDATVLNFGDSEEKVIGALTMVFGGPQYATNAECGAGRITFATFDQFVANFQDDRFVGWSVNGPSERASFSGPQGVTLGMAAADLKKLPTYDPYEESTLGEEFLLGGEEMLVSGLVEANQVAVLWGGVACNFR